MALGLRLCSGLALVCAAAGYAPAAQRGLQVVPRGTVQMGAPAIVAKKALIVDAVKETLKDSSLIFCVRSEGITANELAAVRQKLPDETTMRCVKNTLLQRACEEYSNFPVADAPDFSKYSNYWFFVPETEIRSTVECWDDFIKESKKEDNAIVGGCFEGQVLDPKGIEEVTKLPTKQELMGTTAALLKALPTKLARSLKAADATRIARGLKQAQGQKLAIAVDLMKDKL